jgi:hypothetical protein
VLRQYRVGGQTARALDEISLRLEGGQFVSMVGANRFNEVANSIAVTRSAAPAPKG